MGMSLTFLFHSKLLKPLSHLYSGPFVFAAIHT